MVAPLIPPAKRGDRRREVNLRESVNSPLYGLGTGCQSRIMPEDLSPKSMLFGYFDLWNRDGTLRGIHQELHVQCLGFKSPVDAFLNEPGKT